MRSRADFHPYQDRAVTELYERQGVLAIIPTGGGKTAVSLTAFAELQEDKVVRSGVLLAPKKIANAVWPYEPAEWEQLQHLSVEPVAPSTTQLSRVAGEGDALRTYNIDRAEVDIHCVGMDFVTWLLNEVKKWHADDPRFDVLIVDEASKFKTPSGAWAKTLRKLAPLFKNVWLLTGTPRPNSLEDYYIPITVISRDKAFGRSFYKWQRENFYPTDWEQRVWEPHRHAVPEIHDTVSRWSFRVPLSEVPRPASDPINHDVIMPQAARVRYKKMERELFATMDNGVDVVAFTNAVASGKLAQAVQGFMYDDEKIAHSLHHAKMDVTKGVTDDSPGDPFLMIYWFNEDLARLQKAYPDLVFMGAGVSDKRSKELELEWNKGNLPFLAIHPASAGHGLNLQGTPCQMLHYALTWSAELYAQTVARAARQGYAGGDLLLNHHIKMKDTVDEAKVLRVAGKLTAEQASLQYIQSV